MKIYYFDELTKYYSGEGEAKPGDVPDSWIYPANATSLPPLELPNKISVWDDIQWTAQDIPTPQENREVAYEKEADCYKDMSLNYLLEYQGYLILDDKEKADVAYEKMSKNLKEYLKIKEDIRNKYPDSENPNEQHLT